MPNRRCRICDSQSAHREFTAREMMFGTRESFEYFECADCGCVQIAEIPPDLSRYYPAEYYSYHAPSVVKSLIKGAWLPDELTLRTAFLRLSSLIPGSRTMPAWIARARLSRDARVLEVGCGAGERLLAMRSVGFRTLTGADPFLPSEQVLRGDIRLLKLELDEIAGPFEFIMLHHSFEHMPDQRGTLLLLKRLLAPGGKILLRIPIASSFAWKTYARDWVQLDPPRHLYLHTEKSLAHLAAVSGFQISDRFWDSYALQFWGSEQYRHDVPLRSEKSYAVNRRASAFSREDIRRFARAAEKLNERGEGDQAAFFLELLPILNPVGQKALSE